MMRIVSRKPASIRLPSMLLPSMLLMSMLPLSTLAGAAAAQGAPSLETAAVCMGCHNGLVTSAGEDVSIGTAWRASMMANAARDPYWQAAVRREVTDHPAAQAAIEAECSTCHMPMAHARDAAAGIGGQVFARVPDPHTGAVADVLAVDGVSCALCHQVSPEGLGTRESFTGGFVVQPGLQVYGPFATDAGRARLMRSTAGFQPVQGTHVQRSEMCATCHTLYTHALGPDGGQVGELPEQVPYLEWRHSAYRDERSCQDCHMPEVAQPVSVTGVHPQPRARVSRHVFRGGNFFLPRVFARYRDELAVAALPGELETQARLTEEHLGARSAELHVEQVGIERGELRATVRVRNLAGHKLPTAYPSRRAWIHLRVLDAAGQTVFESGAPRPDGSIAGNDNDADPARYEPHHREIRRGDDVQVYESILAGPDGAVTTGLLTAVRFAKDNRVLPRGFDKATAGDDVAVRGAARDDPDFGEGGDAVRYRVDVAGARGPFRVEAVLRYQPIAYRWADNLARYRTPETDRFVGMYRSMADVSDAVLASAWVEAR